MKLDNYDFERTAKALIVMNPSDRYETWEDLVSFMTTMAYQYSSKNNSFSTGGFVLTAYDGADGERSVRASVSAHVAFEYVKKVSDSYASLLGQTR